MMNTMIETALLDRLRTLDEDHQAEVLDFVEFIATRQAHAHRTLIDPARDFPRFRGTEPITEESVAFQRQIRDTEWR